jgi:RecB family exonuclease
LTEIVNRCVSAERKRLSDRQRVPQGMETAIEYRVKDSTVSGKIDRYDQGTDGITIVDYKTGEVPAVNPDQLMKGLLPQLYFYALALTKSGAAVPIAAVEYVQVLKNKVKAFADSPEAWTEILAATDALVARLIADIQDGKFYQRNAACYRRCPYEYMCRMRKT